MVTTNPIEQRFTEIEQTLLSDNPSPYYPITSKEWRGIFFYWKANPKKRGGNLRRKGIWGNIHYSYYDKELTRDEAISEVCKPMELRQALIEAQTVIECSMCGKVVVGKEAMNPYQSVRFEGGNVIQQKQWGLMFYRMNPDRLNEPETLNICPDCMDKIAKGKFRKLW